MEFATKTIHAGQPSEPETGSLIAPIFQTSTYEQDEPGVNRGFDYSRTNNPTRARLEAVLAELEGRAVLRHVRLRARRRERGAPGVPEAGRRDRHPARRLRRHLPDPEQGVPADRLRDQADRPRTRRARSRRRCRRRRSWCGSSRRPIRGCWCTTSRRLPRRRTPPARWSSSTTRSRRRSSSSRSSSAPTWSCTA